MASLQNLCIVVISTSIMMDTVGKYWIVAHPSGLIQVDVRVYPQNLHCDRATSRFALPHIGEAALVKFATRPAITKLDL